MRSNIVECFLTAATSINGSLLTGMYLLHPVHHYTPLVFLLAGGWGIADGIWQTQTCSKSPILLDIEQCIQYT